MSLSSNIALIGARGAGKSKTSRGLSKISGKPIMSTDSLVCYEAGGKSIKNIVSEYGWKGFREMEAQILQKVSVMQNIIIDSGGGILREIVSSSGNYPSSNEDSKEIFSEKNALLLKSCSYVVFLKRSIERLIQKNQPSPERPPLGVHYPSLLEERSRDYERVADLTIDMDVLSVEEASQIVLEKYSEKYTEEAGQIVLEKYSEKVSEKIPENQQSIFPKR